MSFGSRLKDKRKEIGITQPQLAELLGVSQSAIGSWETDVNSPRATLLYDLFDILRCDANYLFQDETKELYKDNATPEEFENIIKKYRLLDPHGKEMVDFTLEKEYDRSIALKKAETDSQNKVVKMQPHLEVNAACPDIDSTAEERIAGDTIMADDSEWK